MLLGGVSHTVNDPSECPATWRGAKVVYTEVFGAGNEVVGYWCLAEGSIGRDGNRRHLTIPVGEAEGYPVWYGLIPLVVAFTGFGLTRLFTKPGVESDTQVAA